MFNRVFTGTLVVALMVGGLAAPTISNAQSADQIEAQIRELLGKVQILTNQINELRRAQGVPGGGTDASPVKHRVCSVLNRNLGVGAQGDDVRSLQEFLRENGYFNREATGYFGTITAEAVKAWQASHGVVTSGSPITTGWGVVGPMTRAKIVGWCGGIGGGTVPLERRLAANPSMGPSPLTVTFDTWISGFRPSNIQYVLEFGDGTSENVSGCPAPADACTGPGKNTHTYTQDGTYTARLIRKETNPCVPTADTVCAAWFDKEEVIATTMVQVGRGPMACTKEYQPVCGAKPIVCITTPCDPIPTTYSNKCLMAADGASYLYEGVCRNPSDPATDPQCKSWYDGCNHCGRSTPGGPAMCTLRACSVMEPAYCTAYFDGRTPPTPPMPPQPQPPVGGGTVCPADAFQCPNGSWVGRTGSNCQFVCPN